jgi:hypothetical protein
MACRCGERAAALTKALIAIADGDADAARAAARFVVTSAAEDARAGLARAGHAAAARLGIGRR